MSTFKVAVEKIAKIINHPNAERLDIAELEGMTFQFVVGRGQYQEGDLVVYFPLDAIVPASVTDKIGLTSKLGGKNKDRVKTIRLRGEISQGVVGPLSLLDGLAVHVIEGDKVATESPRPVYHDADGVSLDFAPALGITKYEPPQPGEPSIPGARREPTLPEGVAHYDIEGCDRYKVAVEQMLDWPVLILEKLEGSNTAVTRYPDGRVVVCSRNHELVRPEDLSTCRWHRGCQNSALFDVVEQIAQLPEFAGKQVTLRGELVGPGVQENIYKLTDYAVPLFEIEADGRPLCGRDFANLVFLMRCVYPGLTNAPLLNAPRVHPGALSHIEECPTLRTWLEGRTVRAASTAPSYLNPAHLREGIVIRPWREEHNALNIRGVGRPILKQRSPEYLEKTGL